MNNRIIDMDSIKVNYISNNKYNSLKNHKCLCLQIQDNYIEISKNLKENN